MSDKLGKLNKPFKIPSVSVPSGHSEMVQVCKDCYENFKKQEKQIMILELRVGELEKTWLEALEEGAEMNDDSWSIGSEDTEEFQAPKPSKKESNGQSLLRELKRTKK